MRPVILKGMIVCGNYSHDQLYLMAQSFQKICEENQVSFAGMEIAALLQCGYLPCVCRICFHHFVKQKTASVYFGMIESRVFVQYYFYNRIVCSV